MRRHGSAGCRRRGHGCPRAGCRWWRRSRAARWRRSAGIDPALLEEVFVDGFSTKGSQDGRRRGIGLALVHRLVTRAGGTITAHSPGGACFEVVLPLRLPAEIR
ncbi:MAG: ATP-binding protein [Lapillicoccus sp.]